MQFSHRSFTWIYRVRLITRGARLPDHGEVSLVMCRRPWAAASRREQQDADCADREGQRGRKGQCIGPVVPRHGARVELVTGHRIDLHQAPQSGRLWFYEYTRSGNHYSSSGGSPHLSAISRQTLAIAARTSNTTPLDAAPDREIATRRTARRQAGEGGQRDPGISIDIGPAHQFALLLHQSQPQHLGR
jgi:hypothetical protein